MRQLLILAAVPLSVAAALSLAGCQPRDDPSGAASGSAPAATLASKAPAPSGAPKPNEPRVISWPDAASLEQYYPENAEGSQVNGMVRIIVTVDKAGRATDTHVISETPADLGFAAATSTLAHAMSYSNPTGHAATVTFNVKFAAPAANLSRLQRKMERLR